MPASDHARDVQQQLREACGGDTCDIAAAALLLAALRRPAIDLQPYRAHLVAIAEAVSDLVRRRGALPERLGEVLAASYGYRGDTETYDDLQNADFVRVIDRRKGLPVALSILYMHVARAQGWACDGLAFPGHFLIRLDCAGDHHVLDPFHGGIVRAPSDLRQLLKSVAGAEAELAPEHFDVVSDREVLLRLENNTKSRLVQRGENGAAAETLARMLIVAPDRPALLLELGMLQADLGHTRAALQNLERFLVVAGDGEAHATAGYRVAQAIQTLRRQMN